MCDHRDGRDTARLPSTVTAQSPARSTRPSLSTNSTCSRPPLADRCSAVMAVLPRIGAQNGARQQCALPVTGSSSMLRSGAKNRLTKSKSLRNKQRHRRAHLANKTRLLLPCENEIVGTTRNTYSLSPVGFLCCGSHDDASACDGLEGGGVWNSRDGVESGRCDVHEHVHSIACDRLNMPASLLVCG